MMISIGRSEGMLSEFRLKRWAPSFFVVDFPWSSLIPTFACHYFVSDSLATKTLLFVFQEVPGNSMPLFKLVELLETRYHCSVSISEVNKLKDVCTITDDSGGRSISLTPEVRCSPPSNFEKVSQTFKLLLQLQIHVSCIGHLKTRFSSSFIIVFYNYFVQTLIPLNV